MTPFLGQGACQALEDAVVLAAELAVASDAGTGDGDGVPAALARYDHTRRPRSQQIARAARADPRISLSTSAVTYGLMPRLAGAGVAQRKSARLWQRTPPPLGLDLARERSDRR